MRRTHRLPARLIRRSSVHACLVLVLASLAIIPFQSSNGKENLRSFSTNDVGDGGERVRIASADARGRVGTVHSHHARTTRSLPAGGSGSSSLPTLQRLINPARALSNHRLFDFIYYPAFHMDTQPAPFQSCTPATVAMGMQRSPSPKTLTLQDLICLSR